MNPLLIPYMRGREILLMLALIPCSLPAPAQDPLPAQPEINWVHGQKAEAYGKIEGSPYYGEWGMGKIVLKDGTVYEPVYMNYDVYKGKIHVKNQQQGLLALHSEIVDYVLWQQNGDTLRLKAYSGDLINLPQPIMENAYTRFYEVIYDEGKYAFFRLPVKVVDGAKPNTSAADIAYTTKPLEGKFRYKELFVLRKPDGSFQLLARRKKAFLQALSTGGESIKEFVKTEKISFIRDEDIQILLKFADQQPF
ncbi:MAG: hypothetical protein D6730_00055 [Bacteroidetes bacterium]|nr:MAG: hypothetical protein D6730_00055 [Bacteroidota bacterium]